MVHVMICYEPGRSGLFHGPSVAQMTFGDEESAEGFAGAMRALGLRAYFLPRDGEAIGRDHGIYGKLVAGHMPGGLDELHRDGLRCGPSLVTCKGGLG
jgi:hypothetical protein